MSIPSVPVRVKERCQIPSHRIKPVNVRPFAEIAAETGPREVFILRQTTMLLGNDVVAVKWKARLMFAGKWQ
jgi:hypothetical protein